MRSANTIAKAQTRPNTGWKGLILRYCATYVFLPLIALVVAFSSIFALTNTRAQAATNSTVNFQARILQSSGSLVPDGDYNVEFKIYDSPSAGATGQGICSLNSSTDDCWWVETRTGINAVRVVNGYISVSLGSVTPFGASIPWDQDLYVTMRVGGIGTPSWDTEMVNATTGRMKLSATPYALRAGSLMNSAGTLSFNADNLLQLGPSASQNVSSAGSAINVNQTGAGTLLDLRASGSSKLTVDATGNTVVLGTVDVRGSSLNVGTSSVAGSIILNDGSANTSTIQAASTASNLTFVLPSSYGNNGDCLTGNGAGVLTFASTCGGTLSVNPTANVIKSADQTQTNATNPGATLTNDTDLKFNIGANETWSYRFVIHANANVTPDIKFAVTAPAGATCKIGFIDAEGAVANGNTACGVSSGLITGNTTEDVYEVVGTVVNGATPGTIQLQWAQNTANAAATVVRAGSYLTANRIAGAGQTAQAFVQSGNSFGATAVLGTNDSQALSVLTSGVERIRVLSTGNVGIGVATPASLFSVGTGSAFQVNASGNITTTGTATIGGLTTVQGSVVASGVATGTTGTTVATPGTNTTTVTLTAAGAFANNDVIFINNAGQDYYTRIVSGGGTTTLTVSPAVSYDASAPVTKYTIQNVGATPTDYTTQANRFFQGYFLGGVVVGAGSTTLSDGNLSRTTGDITIQPGAGGTVQVAGTLNATTITGDGSGITNINGASISGATITGIDASNISTGTLSDGLLSNNVVLLNSSQSFTALKTFGAGATITSGQTFTVNGDGFTDLTGTGLQINGGALEAVLGTDINLASSEVTGTLGIGNGGTGAISAQSAINNLAGLTATGDLLYYDGANATRLPRGGNGQCLTSNATTIVWGSCSAGVAFTLAGSAGTAQTLNPGDTITIAAGSNITTTAGATDTLTIDIVSAPTFAGLVTASGFSGSGSALTSLNGTQITSGTVADARLSTNVDLLNLAQTFTALKTFSAGATITTGQTFTINGDGFTDLTGNGLTLSAGTLAVAYGSTANTAVQGNTGITITAGNGLSGGGAITLGAGGTVTLNLAYGSTANTAVQGNTAITCPSGTGNLTGGGTSITLGAGGTCGAISTNNAVSFSTSVTSPSFTSTGAVSLTSTGANAVTIDSGTSGSVSIAGTTATALTLGNSSAQTTLNGTTLVLGTSTIRRTAVGTTNFEFNDTANTTVNFTNTDGTAVANMTIEGSITAASLAGSGTGLTALNATNVGSGTLADARLSGNVATLSGAQSFTGTKTFGAGVIVTTGQTITVNGEAFSDLTGTGLTFSGGALTIDTTYFNANYIQLGSASIQTDASANSTIGVNKTNATGNLITLQRGGTAAFTVANSGALQIRATSTTGLDIQSGGGTSLFTVDTSGNIVRVGASTADGTGVIFVLDTKNTAGDPTGVEGAQYYNSASGTFRCYQNARGWTDCLGAPKPNTRRATQFLANGTATTLTGDGGDVATVTGTGSAQAATTAIPASVNFATAAGANSDTGVVGNLNYNTSASPSFQANIRLVSTATTRNWVGLTDQTLATMNGNANPNGNYAAFRYDTSAGDANWQCVTKNNVTQSIVNSGIAASTTNVELEIIIANGSTVEFKINGVAVCNINTNMPSNATMLRYNVSRRNLAAGAQSIQTAWIYLDSNQ